MPGFNPRAAYVSFVVDKVALRHCSFHQCCTLVIYILLLRDQDWKLAKSNALMEIGEHWVAKYLLSRQTTNLDRSRAEHRMPAAVAT